MQHTLTFICLLALGSLSAQGFSGGFKAGLNFSTFDGEAETAEDGTVLETFENTTGFHVAATFAYAFTDLLGVKADLMYSQKGSGQRFEGPSFFYVYSETDNTYIGTQRRSQQSTVNSYIDIPVMAYYRLGPLEIAGGASMGFLVSSNGTGSGRYTNTVYGDNVEIVFNYENNFFQDEAGVGSIIRLNDTPVAGTAVRLPSVFGAYYNHETSEPPLYNRLDFGLVGELNYFLNNGLFVGARYSFGLSDVTDEENDLQQQRIGSNTERVYRDDNDRNRSLQVSLGFRF